MAVTQFQRLVCRLMAEARIATGESYMADGVALNTLLDSPRLSRDIDIFHDPNAALTATWTADRQLLGSGGCRVEVLREQAWFVEARVSRDGDTVLVEWARDSAYRFFPLVRHPDFGLVLHPFDLANSVGCGVLDANGDLFRGDPDSLRNALREGTLRFHPGSIRGSVPRVSAQ